MVSRGLLTSAGTICYTLLLIFMLLYIASCLIIELITKPGRDSDDEDMRQMVKDYWSNMFHIMMTLIQFVTFDSIGSIYVPMIDKSRPQGPYKALKGRRIWTLGNGTALGNAWP